MQSYSYDKKAIDKYVDKNQKLINSVGQEELKNGLEKGKSYFKRATSTWYGLTISVLMLVLTIMLITLIIVGLLTMSMFQYVKLLIIGLLLCVAIWMLII